MKILNILGLYKNDTPSCDLTLNFQMLKALGNKFLNDFHISVA
jgi:hypothetical protein